MYPLLLHAVLVRLFRASDLSDRFTGALGLPLFLMLCLLVMPVMVWKPVRLLFRPVIEPQLRWLLHPDAPQAASAPRTDAPPTDPRRR